MLARLLGLFISRPRYRHKVRGTTYEVITTDARAQCSTGPIQDMDDVFVYRDVDTGKYSVRKPGEFLDGRFERLS